MLQQTSDIDEITETEEAVEAPEIIDEAISEETQEPIPQVDELVEDEIITEEQETPKQRLGLQKPIIIACCIFFATLVAFGGLMVFDYFTPSGIEGTWVLAEQATMDEAKAEGNGVTYFTFDKDGTASMTMGNVKMIGDWQEVASDAGNVYSINIPNSFFYSESYGDFTATVEGNIFTGRTLTFDNAMFAAYLDLEFVSTSIPEMGVKADGKEKIDEAVVGEWVFSNEMYGGTYTYCFNDDGTFEINEAGIFEYKGTYSAEDGKLTLSFVYDKPNTIDMTYEVVDDNTVIFNSQNFTRQ